ncbi:amidohydrolase family protein [Nonomuraea sp. NN258]|uniref:amidohydrolase family protein n=1 Tax=Nonomuraea antri TaxID=2730852 RepID=UPI0015693D0E|nr:amidohydrolase family protein [Nonomuraea antri]NRQ37267.1 amidohydrolase family protein [Nonomuraea antri]
MLAIRARRLFDGTDLHHDRVVTVEDGRISAVTGEVAGAGDDGAVDLGDVTVLPGLIDCHVHLAFDAGPDPVAGLEPPGLIDRMREAARGHLAAGVTTVRDLGDRDFLALRLGLGDEGPEVLAAGPPITTSKGHCWFLGGAAEGEAGVRAAVRERAERGAHVIKMMVTGGEMTPGTHSHVLQYSAAELKAAADEAHAHGLPITGHANCGQGVAHAMEAGFDSIEHCSFFTEDSVEVDYPLIARLAAADVVVSLTAGLAPTTTPMPPRVRARIPGMLETARAIYAAGVSFVIGTDAGIGPPKPHGVLPYGAEMLVELGYHPLDVLRAMTSVAARVCRVDGRKGAVAPGFDADLLVVAGDPVADMTALRRPVAVYRRGRLVAR